MSSITFDGSKHQNIDLPYPAYLMASILTKEECEQLVNDIEARSDIQSLNLHEIAFHKIAFPEQHRVSFVDATLSNKLCEYVFQHVDMNIGINETDYRFDGLSDHFTYVHYYNGGNIRAHIDRYTDHASMMTCLIYLNDNYDGGETFFSLLPQSPIEKKQGSALCFMGSSLKHGCNLVVGEKKILLVKLRYVKI